MTIRMKSKNIKSEHKNEYFKTPRQAVEMLVEYHKFPTSINFHDFSCGDGCIGDYLSDFIDLDFRYESDIENPVTEETKFSDEIIYTSVNNYVIMNPPFSLKTLFLEKCMEVSDISTICLLTPDSVLWSKARSKIFKEYDLPLKLLIPDVRIGYSGHKSCQFDSLWLLFGKTIDKDEIVFCEYKK